MGVDRSRVSRSGTVNHQQFADLLNRCGTQFGANLLKIGGAIFTAVTINAYLDQLVRLQVDVDFRENCLGEAIFGNRHDGIQVVGLGAQFAALGGSQLQHINLSKTAFYRMKRTRTSKAWMREHVNDPFVQLAKKEGWRSRAAFKLMEMDDKDKLLKRGEVVVDLGATPGGWSQVAARRVGETGMVLALDLLEMEPIHGVDFIQGDFREDDVLAKLEEKLNGRGVGLVMSDMAPNMSGVPLVDQARIMYLAELGLAFSQAHLKPDGAFLVKVFQGADYEAFLRAMRDVFKTVAVRKPEASRDRSAELYLLGRVLR